MKDDKKKIIFLNNHFQYSDGTVRALIGLVNNLDPNKYDITIKPIYRCDRALEPELREGIKLETGFGFYFRGFDKIVKILPIKWLYRKFINGKYDIEVGFQAGMPTLLVGKSFNKLAVHVTWMHGFDLWPECHERCDKVVCVSKYCSDKTKAKMGNKVNVTYCYNLVDDEMITNAGAEPVNDLPKRHPLIVSVGRHSREKGYARLVKIMRELRDEGYCFSLVLVGDGPQYAIIKKCVVDLGMVDMITLLGELSNPYKYTSKADLFVCSSFSEGYSTACTEAAILGIPILTTDVPGGQEITKEAECGMLVGLDDESLKEGLRKILSNPNVLNEWKIKAKATSYRFKLSARKKAAEKLFEDFVNLRNTL
ncbi:glycosyltransferase [Cloacibacillus evryensis]|uniref:glycosyltransferase n=1 Tax=Cloacibacillus evryensis TaxID=508460 RepID=UPI0026E0629E|nr:glycosyltransferase [Cloacibacillus evryensis]